MRELHRNFSLFASGDAAEGCTIGAAVGQHMQSVQLLLQEQVFFHMQSSFVFSILCQDVHHCLCRSKKGG